MTEAILTQDELKKKLTYNPETGIFTRKNSNFKYKAGTPITRINDLGYLVFSINYKNYYCHRLAWLYMTGSFPKDYIDHINTIRSDNRWCNLREAENYTNQLNTKLQKRNKSGHKGVSWLKSKNRWRVSCSHNKIVHYLGVYTNIEDAKKAYDEFAITAHGEFYREASQPTLPQTVSAQDRRTLKSDVVNLQASSNVE